MSKVKVLVTGANGFVGRHLAVALQQRLGERLDLLATSRSADGMSAGVPSAALDITDAVAVDGLIASYRPTHVVNLAGMAAPRAAADNQLAAWQTHFGGVLHLGNAILAHAPQCVLLAVGTGLCYGATAKRGVPLTEAAPLAPVSPYETTKAAGDLAAGGLSLQGLRVIRLRPFNHTGPGQTTDFVAPDFAMQIARIEAGLQEPLISVGNLDAERDFLDVRDVADAYVAAIENAAAIAPGTALNIASGQPVRISYVLDRLLAMSTRSDIKVTCNPARMRPAEFPFFVGDSSKARKLLGWWPQLTLDQTLADVLADCRARLKAA